MPIPEPALAERASLRSELHQRLVLRYNAKVNSVIALGALLGASRLGEPTPEHQSAIALLAPVAAAVFAACWLHHVLRVLRLSAFLRAQEHRWPNQGLAYEEFVALGTQLRWLPGVGSAALMFLMPAAVSAVIAETVSWYWALGTLLTTAMIVVAWREKRRVGASVTLARGILERCADKE